MAHLEQLYEKYGSMHQFDITLPQLKALGNDLKSVEPSEVSSLESAQKFLTLLRKFREGVAEADKLHGENYPQLLNSLLSVGEDGVYSDNLRFIFELIQNVDDCDYDSDVEHVLDIHFDFSDNKIILCYNEKGFTPFNVFAITGIAEAAKNVSSGKNEIGEKGIGFKSVFGVAKSVLIRSGWFAFELHKDNFTIPVSNYQKKEYCKGTEMTLFLSGGKTKTIYSEIKKQYCNKDALFSRNPLLFLNKLTSLKMYNDSFRTMEFRVSRSVNNASSKFIKDENVHISVDLHDYESGSEKNIVEEIYCTRYSYLVSFSESACQSRYGYNTKVGSGGGKPMRLQAVFPHPEYLEAIGNGALYSFLPTKLRFNVPIVCHVPFKLDASREFVDPQDGNLWFRDAYQYFSELLDYAYQDFACSVKNDIVFYLPGTNKSLFADNNGKEECLSRQPNLKCDHFTMLPIFYTANGRFVNVEKIFCFDSTEGIFEPERAYRLLQISNELFILPEKKNLPALGISKERNTYQKLFAIALRYSNRTEDILRYLSDAGFLPSEADIPKASFELQPEQIYQLIQYEPIFKLFIDYSKKCLVGNSRPTYTIKFADSMSTQQALYQDFKLYEAPKAIEDYLARCNEQCVLLNIETEQYFPCRNGLVLSAKNPLASFSAFCYAIDNKDTFSIRMRHKEISERLNALSESDEGSAEDYLRELRNNRLLGRDAIGRGAYQNYIDLILRSGTNHTRFIQELLQNADDCNYADGVTPEFSLVQNRDRIEVQYNELGFTRDNIRAITAVGESTKNHLLAKNAEKIGEKGVGFKTIFAVADTVNIHSGQYHFALYAKQPTIPELISGKQAEVLGTKMEISIKPGVQLSNSTEREVLELCFCLRNLRRIRINNISVAIEDSENTRTITINKRQYTFRRFMHRFTVGLDALKERENGLRSISRHQNIVCYIPDKNAAKDYPLYCGLPTKHRIKIPVVIDAPFMLTTSREEIEYGSSLWNNQIRTEMYTTLLDIMDELKYEDRHRVLRFVRFVPRRQGTQTVYTNDISDCEYLNRYDFLSAVRTAKILPTYDKSEFVSAKHGAALRYPDAVNYLFSEDCFATVNAGTALDIPREETLDSILNAIGCPEATFEKIFPILQEYAVSFIREDTFRDKLYACLQTAPEAYQESMRDLAIIPVYSVSGALTEYIPWEDDVIFIKKDCTKSEHNYYILNERLLPKHICEKILGVDINKMDAEWERSRYNDGIRSIVKGNNVDEIYAHLLREFSKGAFDKYQSWELLRGMKEYIPLKNQLGEIVDTGVFICDEVTGYFQSNVILSISVHDECKKLASRLRYPMLSDIHYQDIPNVEQLTGDDIDDLSNDYFNNSEEILRNFYREGKLSEDLVAEYGLEYIAMQPSQDDDYLEFPENPVRNIEKLRNHIRSELKNLITIIPVKVERTVHKCRDSRGHEYNIDDRNVRNRTLTIYTPEGVHGRCFCQMCRKVKPYDFMEVNNIIAEPKYFFYQARVALCLECSKRFEAMRLSNAQKSKQGGENTFITALRHTKIGSEGCVDIPMGKETIRFTATHLAEIQEIFREMYK